MTFKNHLVYRLVILNSCAGAGLVWAWQQGFIQYIQYDSSRISFFILAMFAVGMVSIFQRALKVTKALNAIKDGRGSRINAAKFEAKGRHIDTLATMCVGVGFFGTIVGIVGMLFGNGGIQSDGSVESISAIIDTILANGGTAFITTGAGLATSNWLEYNASILATATTCMIEDDRVA